MYGHVCMFVTCMHEHTIWLEMFGAEDIPGLHLGYPQMPYCCIRGRKLSNTGILHSVCEISPYRDALTQPEHLRNGCCLVML